eukprot:3276966-Pleurochrysis_carterae.AAC.2
MRGVGAIRRMDARTFTALWRAATALFASFSWWLNVIMFHVLVTRYKRIKQGDLGAVGVAQLAAFSPLAAAGRGHRTEIVPCKQKLVPGNIRDASYRNSK